MQEPKPTALKDLFFDAERFRHVAQELQAIDHAFDSGRFLELSLHDLESLSLMQRLRRMTEGLHATLPGDYHKSIGLLRELAPRINHNFVTLVLPDYVSRYGLEDFDVSMQALEFFTLFGSSEFAIREFLRRDLARTLLVMETWAASENEAVRRLASEGSRPRLPWSFRIEALIADPSPVGKILEDLKNDPSLYVRKSVANHLNDITKDNPDWVLKKVGRWGMRETHTAWIIKRALRTMVKKGDQQALKMLGAGDKAKVAVLNFAVQPRKIRLGDRVQISFQLQSKAMKPQKLLIDYTIHYVKKSGENSPKVFKLKELTLGPGETIRIQRSQMIKDFTTRTHYPGEHQVALSINGETAATDGFHLLK